MQLSDNFKLAEFEMSGVAQRAGLDNRVPEKFIPRIEALVVNVLQPIRDKYGPVVVTSGYRSPEVNRRVGGVPSSQHVQAYAADIKVPGASHKEICKWLEKTKKMQFDQLIYEYGENGWIHVSYRADRLRNQTLTKKSGVRGYLPGIKS